MQDEGHTGLKPGVLGHDRKKLRLGFAMFLAYERKNPAEVEYLLGELEKEAPDRLALASALLGVTHGLLRYLGAEDEGIAISETVTTSLALAEEGPDKYHQWNPTSRSYEEEKP